MKTTVDICTCDCGKNTIILDENFQGVRELNDIECPMCGGEIVETTTREIDISYITLANKEVEAEREEKTLWKGKYLALKEITESFLEECECNYPHLSDQDEFEEMQRKFYDLTRED